MSVISTMKTAKVLAFSNCPADPLVLPILEGVRSLLGRAAKPRRLEWITSVRSTHQTLVKASTLSGASASAEGADMKRVDVAVFAGGIESIIDFIQLANELRCPSFFFLSGDVPLEVALPSDHATELHLLKPAVVFSHAAGYQALARFGVTSHVLPCPSLFASRRESPARQLHTIGVLSDNTARHSGGNILVKRTLDLLEQFRSLYNVVFIIYDSQNGVNFEALDVRIHNLAHCDLLITFNLTDALFANSLLKPAILPCVSDYPCSALDLYPFVFKVGLSNLVTFIRDLPFESVRRSILNWKRLVESEYIILLKSNC